MIPLRRVGTEQLREIRIRADVVAQLNSHVVSTYESNATDRGAREMYNDDPVSK